MQPIEVGDDERYDEVCRLTREVIEMGRPSDYTLVGLPTSYGMDVDFPFVNMAVYHTVSIYRKPSYLDWALTKLTDYGDVRNGLVHVSKLKKPPAFHKIRVLVTLTALFPQFVN